MTRLALGATIAALAAATVGVALLLGELWR